MRLEQFLNETVVPVHKKLMQKTKPAKTIQGAVEQLIKTGATQWKGDKIVAQFHVFDPNGDTEVSSPFATWTDAINFIEYRSKEMTNFMRR